ncbi:helix-turn-helix domain-containing protein [Paenibacillus sp. YN15]|uniref:helix-turn-helix domain-containing protein n=1 Tax=Paenibacillus sp. YN15 TaxID=1742774 RepID=UPI000DCB1743|nr:helix-turn-helix domain-containing protein [Paenibacillus sp. YN15]RAV01269.1 AraC family transcriptional regulator [Paenibacillus sp. YN15]
MKHHYKKSLAIILTISSIPGFIIAALVYWMGGGRLERELLHLHQLQIEQGAHNIDQQLSNLEVMLSHWASDNQFDYTLQEVDFHKNYDRVKDITQTLLVMEGSNTLTKRVELCLYKPSAILFDPQYSSIGKERFNQVYQGLLQTDKPSFWTQWAFDPDQPDEKDITLVQHIPGGSSQPFGALLLRLDSDKISSMIKSLMPYNEEESFLIQDSGGLYFSASGADAQAPLVKALREKIGEEPSERSFFYDWQGVTYTVSYGTFSRIASNWTYVSASPVPSITMPVLFISKLIFMLSIVALVLAGVLSWFASHRIFSPVKRLARQLAGDPHVQYNKGDEFAVIEKRWSLLHEQSHEMQNRLSGQLPHVQESFLRQLIQGYYYAYSEEDLKRRMESFRWEIRDRLFVVMYVQLTGITNRGGKFKFGDEGLATFAAVNIISELAGLHFEQHNAINLHNLKAALLVIAPNHEPLAGKLQTFSEELTQAFSQVLNMHMTMVISRPVGRITEIPAAFEGARQWAAFRNFSSKNQVIHMDRQPDIPADEELQYPLALERELIQALQIGQEETAYQLLESFLAALAVEGAKEIEVQMGMLHLLGSIQHAVMTSGIHPNRLFKGANMYEALSQIREPRFILEWFREKIVEPYLQEIVQRTDTQAKRVAEQAVEYIRQYYMKDISPESCAEHTGATLFSLCRSFKQATGKHFMDFVMEVRMDKAKQLLRDTDLLISDVAEQAGFQNSNFHRIFKKQEGMNPTQYKEFSRGKG